jgi:F-type H+-transporting ATPase subunit gamma
MIPLRDIRRQIRSIQKIGHITRAMKTVSMIRLMKVQTQVVRQKPYATKLREVVADLVARTPAKTHPMLRPLIDDELNGGERQAGVGRRVVCLVLGSDRGLCGSFNYNLLDEARRFLKQNEGCQVQLVVVGKRLRILLQSKRVAVDREVLGFFQGMTFDKVVKLAAEYKEAYLKGQLDELWAIYTEFNSTARQRVTSELLLPIGMESNDGGPGTEDRSSVLGHPSLAAEPLFPEYRYEPDPFTVLDSVLPMYFDREAWRIFLESQASEHLARMRAMDMATVNAAELIKGLTLTLNKARQEIITRELSEISSAAEALQGT